MITHTIAVILSDFLTSFMGGVIGCMLLVLLVQTLVLLIPKLSPPVCLSIVTTTSLGAATVVGHQCFGATMG